MSVEDFKAIHQIAVETFQSGHKKVPTNRLTDLTIPRVTLPGWLKMIFLSISTCLEVTQAGRTVFW